MFLGENLPSWLVLAIGAALAVGNIMALARPRPVDRSAQTEGDETTLGEVEYLERPPLVRSLILISLGSVAALWALASLLG